MKNPTKTLKKTWGILKDKPMGKAIFSRMIGFLVPYTGTLGAQVDELAYGRAKIYLAHKRKVSNHLNSIHAVALINLAEMSSGLGLLFSLPDDARGILKGLSISYEKKAKGQVYSEVNFDPPKTNERTDFEITVNIKDASDTLCATAKALWRIGPA